MLRTIQLGILTILVACADAASGATVTQVGGEISTSASGAWGTSPTSGYKSEFRSTDAGIKAYTLPGNPNAYGVDGYDFFGTGVGTLTVLPTYVSDLSVIAGGVGAGAFGNMDNPADGIGPKAEIGTISYGVLFLAGNTPGNNYDIISFTLNQSKTFRVGFMVGDGDKQKPVAMTLSSGAVSATLTMTTGTSNYNQPDWYFFDVSGTINETFTLAVQQGPDSTNMALNGIVFDSIQQVPEPSTYLLLGLGLATMFAKRRFRCGDIS